MSQFKNFEEIRTQYPEMQGLMLAHHMGDTTAHICESEEMFLDDIWAISYDKKWIKIDIANTNEWYDDLTPYRDLSCLILRYNKDMDLAKCDVDLEKLANLQCLRINFDSIDEKNKPNLAIPNLPALKTLTCFGWHEVQLAEKIENIEHIAIYSTQEINLPALLEKLNPQVLRHFHVQFTKDLQFFPDLKKQKKGTSLPTFTGFDAFTNLEHLGVPSHRLKELPFSLAPFEKLKSLDISTNPLLVFPTDFLSLPALRNIDVSNTSLTKNRLVRGGSELVKLINSFEGSQARSEDRKILFDILLENKEIEEIDLSDLLRLFPLIENANLLRKALALGERKTTQNPLEAGKVTNITLLGKLPAMNTNELKAFFKEHNIQIQTKFTPQTQAVCIAEQTKTEELHALLADISKYVVCFPSHLKDFMAQLETPQFAALETESVQSLETLLRSEDETNVLLALQMLKNGGLPDLIFEFLCVKLVRNDWKCRKELMQILEKYASPAQSTVLKKFSGQFQDFEKYLTWLFESPAFDKHKLVQVALKFFTHEKTSYYRRNFLYYLKGLLWGATGETLESVLDHYLQENGTLILENGSMAIREVPISLSGNPRIKKIILLEDIVTLKNRKKARTVLESLPNLTEVEVLYRASENLSEEEKEARQQQEQNTYQNTFPKHKVEVSRFSGTLDGR